MVPGRAGRLVGIGAGLAVALVGCGAGPGADGALPPGASGGTTPESDVCVVVETATGGLLIGLFLDNAGEPTPESTTRLQNGLVRYADLVRENAPGTTHPVLRSVLDRAVAAAEAAADVTTVEELRRTPFKDATIEVGRVCRQVANGEPMTLPTVNSRSRPPVSGRRRGSPTRCRRAAGA